MDTFKKTINEQCNLQKLKVDTEKLIFSVRESIRDDTDNNEIYELTAKKCANMFNTHPDYGTLASWLINTINHKNTPDTFSEAVRMLYEDGEKPVVSKDFYEIVQKNTDMLNSVVDCNRDFLIDYFGFKTLEKSYLKRIATTIERADSNIIKETIVERPQYMWMRVALGINMNNIEHAIETYNALSYRYYTHATPTLFNAGTLKNQLSSCYLLGTEDSISGIFDTIKECAEISKYSGGIGVHVSNVRGEGSYIAGTGGTANGTIPMMKVYEYVARYVNQGGKRKGSIAMYMEPWHTDFEKFSELRLFVGAESEHVKDLFIAAWIPDNFMRRVEADDDWYLMSPNTSPGLTEVYGEEFDALYERYIQEGKYTKKVRARKIFCDIMRSSMETGVPYICFKDTINRLSNHSNIGTIRSSNLCSEIVQYSDSKETANCNLASINLNAFVCNTSSSYNFKELINTVRLAVRNLNRVIDINYYPTEKARYSNLRHRPIGLGVQGLADVFCRLKIAFDSQKAIKLEKMIFESIYYAAITESIQLAKEHKIHTGEPGYYESFPGSPFSKGQFQFDLVGVNPDMYDWEPVRKDIKEYGIRNSMLTALMPTATTSQILGNNECFEPYTSNMYSRNTLAGMFQVVNKYLINELISEGIWNEDLKEKIMRNRGSIQGMSEISSDIQERYKTAWEINQRWIVDHAVTRAPFIDQSQSMNIYMANPTYKRLATHYMYAWKQGLKTGQYYLHTRAKAEAKQFTVSDKVENINKTPEAYVCKWRPGIKLSECEMCSA